MGPHTGRGEGRPPQQCNEGRLQALPRAPPGSTLLRWCRKRGQNWAAEDGAAGRGGAGRRALGELERFRGRPGDNAVSGPESARLPCQHFADLDPGDALA